MTEIIICGGLSLLRGVRDSFLHQANGSLRRCRTSGGRPVRSPPFSSVCPEEDEYLIGSSGTHSSALAWKIPWTEEPGGLQSMGSLRVGHDWATSLSLFTCMHWRRKWQPTPVFLPGESQGRGSLVGCCLWGHRVGHDWSDLAAAAAYFKIVWL